MSRSSTKDGVSQSDDGMEAKLNDNAIAHVAIFLSYFFGKDGLQSIRLKLAISIGFLVAFAVCTVTDVFTGSWVTEHLSIHSRSGSGLVGIIFAPFLHPSPQSAFIDCAPFFLLSMLVMLRVKGIQTFFVLVITNAILGGAIVWMLGRSDTNHCGCGAMIFTLFGYLLLVGIVRRDVRSAIVSVAVFVMYGGLLWALLPLRDRTQSWEGHVMGMVIGCVLGAYDGRAGAIGASMDDNSYASSNAKKQYVKPGDVSEKTGLTAKEEEEA